MKLEEIKIKVLKLAQSQLNTYKINNCVHQFELHTVNCVTLEPRERKCKLCGKIQKYKPMWIDV